jgi:hypothetical protein
MYSALTSKKDDDYSKGQDRLGLVFPGAKWKLVVDTPLRDEGSAWPRSYWTDLALQAETRSILDLVMFS